MLVKKLKLGAKSNGGRQRASMLAQLEDGDVDWFRAGSSWTAFEYKPASTGES